MDLLFAGPNGGQSDTRGALGKKHLDDRDVVSKGELPNQKETPALLSYNFRRWIFFTLPNGMYR